MQEPRPTRRSFLKKATSLATAAAVLPSGNANAAGKKKVKIGQIGIGHAHAAGKMMVYRDSPDYEVVGIVEPNPEIRKLKGDYPAFAGLPWMSQEQLFNVPGLQAVAVETRVPQLLETAEACIGAGFHVHLDKPAGTSLPHFRKLLDEADRKSLTIQLGYMYRYNPAVLVLRDLLSKGWLGEIFEIEAVMSKVGDKASRQRWSLHDGGMMLELGSHLIDLAVTVLGRPDEVVPYIQRSGRFDDTLQDNMLAVLSYPRALVTLKSSANEVSGFDRRHFSVCGTEGTVRIQPLDAPTIHLAFDRPRGNYTKAYQKQVFGRYPRYVKDAADFAEIVRGEKKADFNSQHDYATQETLLRACGMPLV